MKYLLSLVFGAACFAQTLSLTCPTSVKAGTALNCTVSISSAQNTSGVQYTVTTSAPLGTLTATAIGSAAGANKTTSVFGSSVLQVGSGPPGTLNAALIPDGSLATLTWTVPTSLANQTIQLSLGGSSILPAAATSQNGSVIAVAVTPFLIVSVLPNVSLCDLNGDGVVNQADVTLQQSMVMSNPQSANCARNSSGCGVWAIQIIINATGAPGTSGLCTATQ